MACYKIHGTEDAVSEESSNKWQPQTVSTDALRGRTNQEPFKTQIRKKSGLDTLRKPTDHIPR